MLAGKICIKKGNLEIADSLSNSPTGHNISIDIVPSFPDGISTIDDLEAYLKDTLAPLVNAGWSINILIE